VASSFRVAHALVSRTSYATAVASLHRAPEEWTRPASTQSFGSQYEYRCDPTEGLDLTGAALGLVDLRAPSRPGAR